MSKFVKTFIFILSVCSLLVFPQLAFAQWPSDLDGGGNGSGQAPQMQRPKTVNTQPQRQSHKKPRQSGMIPVSKFGMNFQFPASWQTQEGLQDPVIFIAFLSTADNSFRDNIVICAEDLSQSMDIQQYFDLNLKQLENIKILGKGKVTIDGYEGRVLRHSSNTQSGLAIQQEQIFLVVGTKGYVITITAKPNRFEQSIKDAYRLVNTITF